MAQTASCDSELCPCAPEGVRERWANDRRFLHSPIGLWADGRIVFGEVLIFGGGHSEGCFEMLGEGEWVAVSKFCRDISDGDMGIVLEDASGEFHTARDAELFWGETKEVAELSFEGAESNAELGGDFVEGEA